MKPHSLLNSLVLTIAAVAGSLEMSKGIINTFSFDIFRKCVDGEYSLDSGFCQYGPQLSINVMAAVLMLLGGLYLMKKLPEVIPSKKKLFIMSFVLFLVLSAFWRIQVGLQDNFIISSGPETLTEYLYVGFIWLDTVLAGLITGFLAWLPIAVDRNAKTRKEPRTTFVKKA